ncbi:MAG: ABC transporter ATP-binding protein [Chloroflexi bacterium]|nr:ABC transporter ATP-binding protein [Chloroflexota bacterium]
MSMPDDLLLSVRDLKTHFFLDEGVVKSVDGVSFDLPRGRTIGIVGESGCGKSVTARSILRIVDQPGRIVEGKILFNRPVQRNGGAPATETIDLATLDNDSAAIRAIRGADIAMIFQEPMTSFSPVHTIGNQIGEAIMLHQQVDKAEARRQTIDVLHRVGMSLPEQRVDEYPYQLSGGMRQRAMIAMALACHPVLLIADEPTTALDVTTQAQILDLMRKLQADSGTAIMLITHDLGVVAEMCDEVAVMYLGRVVEQAPVDDIFHQPKHPYTHALLQSIPRIDSVTSERLESIRGSVPHPFRRPTGCAFGPRCPSFMAGTCDAAEPALLPVGPRHTAACFLYSAASAPPAATPGDDRGRPA